MILTMAPIIGQKAKLVPFGEADITDRYIGWLNDPLVVRYSDQRFRRHTREACLSYLRSFEGTDDQFFLVRTLAGDRPVGTIVAHVATPHGTADIGILIGERDCWGQSIGLDAWRTLMQFLFQEKGLRKVTGGTLRCNVGMIKVMERSGMRHEATRYRQQIVEGTEQDILYYAKFRED